MAMTATSRGLLRAEKLLATKERALEKVKEREKQFTETATRTVTTMGGAFAMAWFQGRFPERQEILGAPASLVVGTSLTVAVLLGLAGKQADIVEYLGAGSLAVFMASKGGEYGQEAKQKAA